MGRFEVLRELLTKTLGHRSWNFRTLGVCCLVLMGSVGCSNRQELNWADYRKASKSAAESGLRMSPNAFGSGAMPYGSGMMPYGSGMMPYGSGMMPYGSGMMPYGSGMMPYGSGMMPYGSGMMPYGSGMMPYGSGMMPYGSGMMPYGSGMMPYGSGMMPYGSGAVSYGTGASIDAGRFRSAPASSTVGRFPKFGTAYPTR